MELGFYTFGDIHPDPHTGQQVTPGQRIREVLERVRLADEIGLDYAGIGEHHRPDYRTPDIAGRCGDGLLA